jgi:hypothetical protein
MTETEALKKRIVREINDLPPERLCEVLDFVARLSDEERPSNGAKSCAGAPEHDPILEFIGGVSHGSLAHEIDRELYGERQ